MQKYYTIYQTTNLLNYKIYIGKHETFDPWDKYLGSGKDFLVDKKLLGEENFHKRVLHIFDNEDEMNRMEAAIVTLEFCAREDTYNKCPGGHGGWGYVNTLPNSFLGKRHTQETKEKMRMASLGKIHSDDTKLKLSIIAKNKSGKETSFYGRKHSEETKRLFQELRKDFQKGELNSQFGTIWITDGKDSKKINKIEPIPNGWYRGYNKAKFKILVGDENPNKGSVWANNGKENKRIKGPLPDGWSKGRIKQHLPD